MNIQEAILTCLPMKRPHFETWVPANYTTLRRPAINARVEMGRWSSSTYPTREDILATDWIVKDFAPFKTTHDKCGCCHCCHRAR